MSVELEHLESGTGRLIGFNSLSGAESQRTIFEPGDVLYGKLRAYLRKSWFADCAGGCSTEIWVLQAESSMILPEYLAQLVRTNRFDAAASNTHGTHMPRSEWSVVGEAVFDLPALDEQQAIAEVLNDMDAEIEALEVRLAKTRDLKTGMAQELLSGRTRLV